MASLISTEPATGVALWTGESGDADAEVARARSAWAGWAARPLAVRIETLRRFANVVRGRKDEFADLIARETGKPLWESATEVDAVVNKVDISVSAYSERTSQRRLEGALGARVAVRHVRRDGHDLLKKEAKSGVSEDQQRKLTDQIQKMTDDTISEIDSILASKEGEITQV